MTPGASRARLEALVVGRAATTRSALSLLELVQPLDRFAPPELTQGAWRGRLGEVAGELRAQGVLEAGHRLRDADELARRIGGHGARTWPQLAERVLPALALGIAAADSKQQARLAGRDAWAAAIVGRSLGVWVEGAPPSLPAMCDALTWRELGLPGKPKRCPPEIRALFVQRRLASDPGPPERLVRVLAAREVGAPRPELRALRDALVRCWLAERALGAPAATTGLSRSFVDAVLAAAGVAREGRFGDRKIFVSAVWDQLRTDPPWAALALDDFKARLVAAHRAGELTLARADLVAAMDPALVAASEIAADGASFHFLVKEPS
ncbi:MAG TPA: hypothetical protein VLM79_11735 [Kofleriaceae bacterium]|nr:hypothetical protein [Kofleriaceae bacterium]